MNRRLAPPPPLPSLPAGRVADLLDRFQRVQLIVVGDLMLDQFLVGRVRRISPEAPVPVVEFDRDEYRMGGAANVANNARALGARVELVGVVGDDGQAARLREQLATRGVGASAVLTDPNRRTTTKMRIVTDRHQQVARVDYESEADISDELEDGLAKAADRLAAASGAIIVSDYLKGGITAGLMTRLVDIARRREIPVLVDPKVPHIGFYRHTRMVTPNHHEAEIATNRRIRTDSDALAAARDFRERAGCEGVLITRGEHGMWLLDGETEGSLAAVAREVSDVTGAGDTVIATLALAFAAGASMAEAATLANHAGGVSVGKFGPSTVDRAELFEALAVGRD